MAISFGRPAADNEAGRGDQFDAGKQIIAVDDISGLAVFLPGDGFAAFVNTTGENRLRALVAAADAQLDKHFAGGSFELRCRYFL